MGVPRITSHVLSNALGDAIAEKGPNRIARWFHSTRWIEDGYTIPVRSPWRALEDISIIVPPPQVLSDVVSAMLTSTEDLAAMPLEELVDSLHEAAEDLLSRSEDLSMVVAANTGMTVEEAADEVARAHDLIVHAASMARAKPAPRGVSLAVPPYTSPLAAAAAGVAYSMASGFTVILKAPMRAPLASLALADVFNEVGLGSYLSVLTGPSAVFSTLIASNPLTSIIVSFTSREGARVLRRMSHTQLVLPNTMGRSVVVVLDDAEIDLAVSWIAESMVRHGGQACGSAAWAFVTPGVYDEFLSKLASTLSRMKPAPLISIEMLTKARRLVDDALRKGGELAFSSPESEPGAGPTIVSNTPRTAEALYTDVRAPLLFVAKASTPREASRSAASLRGQATSLTVYTDKLSWLSLTQRYSGYTITCINRSEDPPAPLDPCYAPGILPEDPSSAWRPLITTWDAAL